MGQGPPIGLHVVMVVRTFVMVNCVTIYSIVGVSLWELLEIKKEILYER